LTQSGAAGLRGDGRPAAKSKPRIAYAITVTKDGPFVDGAIVLGYAARKVHDPSRGFPGTYEVDLVAFVTPGVSSSRAVLEAHGWRVLEKTLPVRLDEIENKKYVDKVRKASRTNERPVRFIIIPTDMLMVGVLHCIYNSLSI
jgi:hypothetical protein